MNFGRVEDSRSNREREKLEWGFATHPRVFDDPNSMFRMNPIFFRDGDWVRNGIPEYHFVANQDYDKPGKSSCKVN